MIRGVNVSLTTPSSLIPDSGFSQIRLTRVVRKKKYTEIKKKNNVDGNKRVGLGRWWMGELKHY